MRRTSIVSASLMLGLVASACSEPVTAPGAMDVVAGPQLSVAAGNGLQRGSVALPSGLISDLRQVALGNEAINPADYVCTQTEINDFFLDNAYNIIDNEFEIFDLLYNDLLADEVVMYHALYILEDDQPQYFGYNGEYTHIMQKTHRDAKRFFDIESSDIQLLGMHGSMLADTAAVAHTYRYVYGVDPVTAGIFAGLIKDALEVSTTVNGGNHPLFSFNAFAISAPGFIPDKIVMGDGFMAGLDALGYGDVGPQAIYAHEFAHHIQYENGYFDTDEHANTGTGAEQTRYTEMMADAYAAYFLTHARGLALNKHRVAQFLEAFHQIGDCAFTNDGHHGTPNQRMRAAQFGFDVADQAHKQGHIISTEQFHDMFVEAYPAMIAPDA